MVFRGDCLAVGSDVADGQATVGHSQVGRAGGPCGNRHLLRVLQRPIWAQLVDDLRPPHRLACDVARQLAAVVAGTGGTDDHLARWHDCCCNDDYYKALSTQPKIHLGYEEIDYTDDGSGDVPELQCRGAQVRGNHDARHAVQARSQGGPVLHPTPQEQVAFARVHHSVEAQLRPQRQARQGQQRP